LCRGALFSITIVADGVPAPTYQWQFAGAPIDGATGATLEIDGVSVTDAGEYRCVVTNSCGEVTSAVVALTVCVGDFDCSGAPDGDDIIAFFGAWDVGDAAADVTGNGGVDSDDVIAFFAGWDAGC